MRPGFRLVACGERQQRDVARLLDGERVRRRWCVVQTPVRRRGVILPRSATNCCNRRTSRYGIASMLLNAELADLLATEELAATAACGAGGTRAAGRTAVTGGAAVDRRIAAPRTRALRWVLPDFRLPYSSFPFMPAEAGVSQKTAPRPRPALGFQLQPREGQPARAGLRLRPRGWAGRIA